MRALRFCAVVSVISLFENGSFVNFVWSFVVWVRGVGARITFSCLTRNLNLYLSFISQENRSNFIITLLSHV